MSRSRSFHTPRMRRPRRRRSSALVSFGLALVVVASTAMLTAAPAARASACELGTVLAGSPLAAGAEGNPYAVADATDLGKVGIGGCAPDAHYEQTADIAMPAPAPGVSNHTPIGTQASPFRGWYDGAGHSITGLTVVAPSANQQGMFGFVAGALLTRIRLVDVSIDGAQQVGGLIGQAIDGSVEAAQVTGAVHGEFRVGGLVGEATGFIGRFRLSDSTSAVAVTASASTQTSDVGGLVGALSTGDIVRSSATGDVTLTVSGDDAFNVGGAVGRMSQDSSATASFAAGDVVATGTRAERVGGFAGRVTGATLDAVYSRGSVTGGDLVGGLIGQVHLGTIASRSALATGRVAASAGAAVGGFLGKDDSTTRTITSAFWDTVRSEQGSDPVSAPGVVEGRSTADLQRFATFDDAGWAIVDGWVAYDPSAIPVWGICDGAGYPFLLWQFTSDPCASGGAAQVADPVVVTVGVAAEQAAAAGVAGSVSAVRVRDGVVLPVTARVSDAVGPRGGVVLVSEGMEVRVASPLGAREDAGVVVPSSGAFEMSVNGALVPGSVIEVWINSQPRLVAAARVPTGGGPVTIGIPTGAPLDGGDPIADDAHTLQLRMFTVDGYEVVATGITIGRVMPTGVPAGEGPAMPGWVAVVGLLVTVGAMVAVRREQALAG